MGFTGRVLHLRWPEGHELHEMQVDIRPASVAGLDELREFRREGETPRDGTLRRLALVASHVVRWNLDHPVTGEPLKHTAADLDAFDGGAVVELIAAWSDGGMVPAASKAEDPTNGTDREPVDPLGATSAGGLPTGASSEAEALIQTQDV